MGGKDYAEEEKFLLVEKWRVLGIVVPFSKWDLRH